MRRTRKGPSTLYSYRLFYLDGLYLWSFISGVSMVPEPMVDHQRAPKGRAEHPAGRSGRQPCKGSAKREPLPLRRPALLWGRCMSGVPVTRPRAIMGFQKKSARISHGIFLQQVQAVELGGKLFAGQGQEVGNFSL